MNVTTKRSNSANVRIPTVKSLDDDTTITTKNSETPEMSHVASNIVLDGKVDTLDKVDESVEADSMVSIPPEMMQASEAAWQHISSCEVEPFALSNFNFTIPYMDIYEEHLATSKEVRRPPQNSLWAQTGMDDMKYVEDSTIERNREKALEESGRFQSFMLARQESMKVPPRCDSTMTGKVVVSRPSSAAAVREPEPEPEIVPLEPIESVVVTEEQVFEDRVQQIGKTKKQLGKLVDYTRGHANRKIIGAWELIEQEYKSSESYEVKMVPGSKLPVQIKTLSLVKLITILVSGAVQFKKKEIEGLCEKFEVPPEAQKKVRRLSALHITRAATTNADIESRCVEEIHNLTAQYNDINVSISDLQQAVFPGDPERLKYELEMIEREKVAKKMIEDEENKKKMAYADIVEQRRLKGIDDWKRAVLTLQYARGPLTLSREYVLREVIEYAKHVLSAEEAASMTVIDPAVISNLGDDVFGFEIANDDGIQRLDSSFLSFDASDNPTSPEGRTPSQKRPPSSQFRANLRGVSPEQLEEMKLKPKLTLVGEVCVMILLTDAVAVGKGLNGVSFKDVVELVQALSTTKIQTFFRCHTKRWRFEKARNCWKRAFSATKGRVFGAWAAEARKMGLLKHYCMRKIIVWKFYTKRLKERRFYFKQCFWPFYVWRRSVLASTTTKQKTKFLCGRVFPTLIMMRIFRAWADYAMGEAYYTRKAEGFKRSKLTTCYRDSFLWLKYWAHRRKHLRRQWLKEGLTMKRKFDDRCVKMPFQVWYAWIQMKKRMNTSVRANCSLFRSFAIPNRPFVGDREIFYISANSSVLSDLDSVQSKTSRGSVSSSRGSIKPGSKGKKKRTREKSLLTLTVKTLGKRKPLQFDRFKDFSWKMKQTKYDIDSDEDIGATGEEDDEFHSENPLSSLNNPMTRAGTRSACGTPTSRRGSRRPSATGLFGAPPTPTAGRRPSDADAFCVPTTPTGGGEGSAESWMDPSTPGGSRRGSRRSSAVGKIVLGGGRAFAEASPEELQRMLTSINDAEYVSVSEKLMSSFEKRKVELETFDPEAVFYRIRPVTVESISVVQKLLYEAEIAALIEASFRYVRWGVRAFKNLQQHAVICRNLKKGLKKKRTAMLRSVFKILNDNLNRSLSADITTSVTEQLINEARLSKLDKFARRRELTDAIKQYQEHQVKMERERIQAFKASLRQGSSVVATVGNKSISSNNSTVHLAAAGVITSSDNASIDDKDSVFPAIPQSRPVSRPSSRSVSRPGSQPSSVVADTGGRGHSPVSRGGRRQDAKLSSAENRRRGAPMQTRPSSKGAVFAAENSLDMSSVGTLPSGASTFGSTKGNAAQSVVTELSEPPKVDFLFWDREDRELQFNNIQRLVAHGKRMTAMTEYCTNILSRGEDHILKLQAKKFLAVDDVAEVQGRQTKESIEREESFVAGFRVYAANILVNSVYKVRNEFKVMMVKSCMRQYFKALRLSMLLKRSKHMCNRKKLFNWIRICRRLNNIDRLTPKYWRCRRLWGIFNRWLKYYERSHIDATPSVIGRARRGWELRKGFCEHLHKKNVVLTYYHPTSKKIKSPCTDKNGIFQRWKQYVQDRVMYRLLEDFTDHKFKLTLLRKVVYGWRYCTLTHAEQRDMIQSNPDCYAISHIGEDIDQIIKRYVSRVRISLTRKLKRMNMRYLYCVRRDARKVLSFKTFINEFHRKTDDRIKQENSMLLAAFETRGSLHYRHSRALPTMAHLNDGHRFSDPVYDKYAKPVSGLQIPGGYIISKIRIALKGHAGLVGWQLFWDADRSAPIVGPERGVVAGIGVATHDIIIKPLDFLLGVEYIYEGNEMAAIRFNTFKTGWSKWYGSKPSLSAATASFSVDKLLEDDILPQELEYNSTGPEEEKDPALPSVYIIGFVGMDNSERSTCLGVIYRHAITQNIFTYYWVDEGKDDQAFLEKPPLHVLEQQKIEVWDEDFVFDEEDGNGNLKAENCNDAASRPASANNETSVAHAGNSNQSVASKPPAVRKENTGFGAMGGTQPGNNQNNEKKTKKTIIEDDEKDTTESEDTFFDICRMRSVELKQLEERTATFVRKIWSSVKLRYSSRQESKLVGLNVLKGIAKWFFEGLCKKLVPLAQHAEECRDLLKSIRKLTLQKTQCDARLGSIRSGLAHMKSVEKEQPWFGKSFLGPLDRVQRKAYFENIIDYEQSIVTLEHESRESVVTVLAMSKRIRMLTPQLQLSKSVLNNFSLKLLAGRQKYTLLERMTLEQLRLQLMGNDAKRPGTAKGSEEVSASASGAPPDPNMSAMSLEQVCANLESKRLEDMHQPDYSVASSTTASHLRRRTLIDEASSIAGHSLDADREQFEKSYPDGTFGKKLAEGRAVMESKKHVRKALKCSHSMSQLASPKKLKVPDRVRKLLTTDVSPSLKHTSSFTRADPLLKSSLNGPHNETNYDAMIAASTVLRKIPTIDTPIIVPGRRNSIDRKQLSRSQDISARRGQAVLQEKYRFVKPPRMVNVDQQEQYVADLTEEDIRNQKDFEANIHTFLAEQAILAQNRKEKELRKEEVLKRKAAAQLIK